MTKINADMNVNEIRDVMKNFNKEMMKAEVQGDMIGDAMDMAEDPNANAEADDVYNEILGEVGMEMNAQGVASSKINVAVEEEVKVDAGQEDELESRLAALRMA